MRYHYDVSNDFYALFLDVNMVYSCAYFGQPDDTLAVAQNRKLDHILTKLRVAPGEKFLDMGCGWGALVMRAAQKYGAIATGITLSKNQFEAATEHISQAGLDGQCQVLRCWMWNRCGATTPAPVMRGPTSLKSTATPPLIW